MSERRRLGIAIPTFRRPERLAELLAALAEQQRRAQIDAIEVAVFDNDPSGSAAGIVDRLAPAFPFALTRHDVPVAGLCAVRNAILAYARDRFDLLAMIDDDEVPVRGWLEALIVALDAHAADAAVGPVPQVVPPSAPRVANAPGHFGIPGSADGSSIADGYTGNCLVRTTAIASRGLRFDERLNFCGGEDQLFFRQLVRRGGRIVFAAGAVAVERLPPSRTTAAPLCCTARGFPPQRVPAIPRSATAEVARVWKSWPVRGRQGCGLIGLGLAALAPRALLRGRTGIITSVCAIARGCGMLGGLAGIMIAPYARRSLAGETT